MKKLIALSFILTTCSSPKEKQVPFPVLAAPEDEWAVYEGTIITDNELEVEIELSLMQAAVGQESYFALQKDLYLKGVAYGSRSNGKYSVSYGLPEHEQGLTIIDPPIKIKENLITDKGKKLIAEGSEELARKLIQEQDLLAMPELYFKTLGNEKLVQTDRNFNSKTPEYVLFKRSGLFTVEGYVTCEDSVTEFFERNTRVNWKVASLGKIDSVKIKYVGLATEGNEGIYLKALAYSIADATSQSSKALVIKRLLRMEKSSIQNPIK